MLGISDTAVRLVVRWLHVKMTLKRKERRPRDYNWRCVLDKRQMCIFPVVTESKIPGYKQHCLLESPLRIQYWENCGHALYQHSVILTKKSVNVTESRDSPMKCWYNKCIELWMWISLGRQLWSLLSLTIFQKKEICHSMGSRECT